MAFKMFTISIDITPEIANAFINIAVSMNVQCVVAPYEADA
jgi:hypothetical protein